MSSVNTLKKRIKSALGESKADFVMKNVSVLNVFTEQFEKTDVAVNDGVIVGLGSYDGIEELDMEGRALVPSFIDGHVHLESSIVSVKQYCKAVVPHGTAAVIADPHEITNVLGKTGFDYISESSKGLPLDVYLMVPSCVPATPFDESGAEITSEDVSQLLLNRNVLGLAEMMNYPGVLNCDEEVLKKLCAALYKNKIIDGHAPSLSGKELNAYISAGVNSDHECTSAKEAIEKISRGQWVMVREGTACKNLEALLPLFEKPYCDRCMLVTDDKHPGDLALEGHIDHIVRKAISLGANPVNAYKMASFNAAVRFGLNNKGAIAPGYSADFVVLDDINSVKIHSVYKNGKKIDNMPEVGADSLTKEEKYALQVNDTIKIGEITPECFSLKKEKEKIIGLVPGEILTTDEGYASNIDTENDICKLAVIERHRGTGNIGVAFIKGYGLKHGAVATSISHDSHNIIAVGANDSDMAFAVSELKRMNGGMVVVNNKKVISKLPLPIAGLMCDLNAEECEEKLFQVKQAAYSLGVNKNIDPFMTLSFSSLAVIPTLRLTTKGVVDVTKFELL